MKKKLLGLLPYAAVLAVDFYLLPLLLTDTGTAMLMLLVVIPLIALITGVLCGARLGSVWLLPVIAAVLFTPTVWIYYNDSAMIYILWYAGVVLVGAAIGRIFYKKQ